MNEPLHVKPMHGEEVTIVTAFMDIGRGEWTGQANGRDIPEFIARSTDTYMERFERLTKLKNRIVCFTHSKFFEKIKSMREDIELISIDTFFEDHEHLRSEIRKIQKQPQFISRVYNPYFPEYWSPEYIIINALKSHFVNYAIESGWCHTNTTAWIDFGYCRDDTPCPPGLLWKFDTQNKINLFAQTSTLEELWVKPIFDACFTNEVFIQGCHIVAPNNLWPVLREKINNAITTLFNVGLIDDDQTLLLMAYRSEPEKFFVYPKTSFDWFVMFKNYHHDD